jgi:hypothetical protein
MQVAGHAVSALKRQKPLQDRRLRGCCRLLERIAAGRPTVPSLMRFLHRPPECCPLRGLP